MPPDIYMKSTIKYPRNENEISIDIPKKTIRRTGMGSTVGVCPFI